MNFVSHLWVYVIHILVIFSAASYCITTMQNETFNVKHVISK